MLRVDAREMVAIRMDQITDAGLGLMALGDIARGTLIAPLHHDEDVRELAAG